MDDLCIPIPSVTKQFDSYKSFYASLKHEDIEKPQSNLMPFLKTGYAYVYQFLLKEENDKQIKLLLTFWQQAKKDITNNRLTLQRFLHHNLRLAFLLTNNQEKAPFFYGDLMGNIRDFYSKELWIDIEAYDQLELDDYFANSHLFKGYSPPFHRIMIIYHERGDISLRMFVESFIEDDFPFALFALPAKGKGPHGDYYADPLSFFIHDLLHWSEFVHDLASSPQKWSGLREALKQLYHNHATKNKEPLVGAFLLLHEILPFVPKEEKTSAAKIWSDWIYFAKENIASFPDTLEVFVLENALMSSPIKRGHAPYSFAASPQFTLETLEVKNREVYRIPLLVEIKDDDSDSTSPLGLATFTASFAPHDSRRESLNIMDVSFEKENSRDKAQSQDLIDMLKHLEGASFLILSRRMRFNLLFADPITLVNKAYGEEVLSDFSTPQEVKRQVANFLDRMATYAICEKQTSSAKDL